MHKRFKTVVALSAVKSTRKVDIMTSQKSPVAHSSAPPPFRQDSEDPREIQLTGAEAAAAAPAEASLCGEEDPGAGLEFLVQPNASIRARKAGSAQQERQK